MSLQDLIRKRQEALATKTLTPKASEATGLQALIEKRRRKESSSLYSREPSAFKKGLSKVLDIINVPSHFVGGILSGKGVKAGMEENILPSQAFGIKNPVIGFVVDIALDPLTYASFGTSTFAKSAVKGTSKALSVGGKIGGKQISKLGAKRLAQIIENTAPKNLGKLGQEAIGELVEKSKFQLGKEIDAGAKEFLERSSVRATMPFTDKEVKLFDLPRIKPLEKAGEWVGSTKVGKWFDQAFNQKMATIKGQTDSLAKREELLQLLNKQRLRAAVKQEETKDFLAGIIGKYGEDSYEKGRKIAESIRNTGKERPPLDVFLKQFSSKVDNVIKDAKEAEKIKGMMSEVLPRLREDAKFLDEIGVLKKGTVQLEYMPRALEVSKATKKPLDIKFSDRLVKQPTIKDRKLKRVTDVDTGKLLGVGKKKGVKGVVIGDKGFIRQTPAMLKKRKAQIAQKAKSKEAVLQKRLLKIQKAKRKTIKAKEAKKSKLTAQTKTVKQLKSFPKRTFVKKDKIISKSEKQLRKEIATLKKKGIKTDALESKLKGLKEQRLELAKQQRELAKQKVLKTVTPKELSKTELQLRNAEKSLKEKIKKLRLSTKEKQAKLKLKHGEGDIYIHSKTGQRVRLSEASVEDIEKYTNVKFEGAVPSLARSLIKTGNLRVADKSVREMITSPAGAVKKYSGKLPKGFVDLGEFTSIPRGKGYALPKDMAEVMRGYLKISSSKTAGEKFLKGFYDPIQQWWKTNALIGAAYHSRNFVSNTFNMWLAGVKTPAQFARASADMGTVIKASKLSKKLGATLTKTERQQIDLAKKMGVLTGNFFDAEFLTDIQMRIKSPSLNPLSRRSYLARASQDIGSGIEQSQRFALFQNQLRKGKTPQEAARIVNQFLFDYCFDEKTEILTKQGWRRWNTIKKTDIPLTFNCEKDQLELGTIKDVIVMDWEGDLNYWKTTRFDTAMTDNHKWIIHGDKNNHGNHNNIKRSKYSLVKTSELSKYTKLKVVSDNYKEPRKKYDNDFVELVGWVLTEGCYSIQGKKTALQIYQSEKNAEELKELRTLIERISNKYKGTYSEYIFKKDNPIHSFYINGDASKQIRKMFPDKEMTIDFIFSLTRNQLEKLYEIMIKTDGTIHKKTNAESFAQKGVVFTEAFQVLAFLLGKRSKIYKDKKSSTGHYYHNTSVYNGKDVYTYALKKTKKRYNGKVWCITTNNNTLVAKRNGCIYLSGNSDLSQFEQQVLKRVFPFVSWTRKNLPLQLENLVRQPGKLATTEKALRAVEVFDGKTDAEVQDVHNNVAEWLQEGRPVVLPFKKKDGSYHVINAEGLLPVYDLSQISNANFKQFIDMTSPLIKLPAELMTNVDMFKGFTKLNKMEKEGKSIVFDLLDATGREVRNPFLGGIFNDAQAHLVKTSFRPLRDLDKLIQAGRKEKDENWVRATNYLFSKVSVVDLEKQKSFNAWKDNTYKQDMARVYKNAYKEYLKNKTWRTTGNIERIKKILVQEHDLDEEAIIEEETKALREVIKYDKLDELIKKARTEGREITQEEKSELINALRETYKDKSYKRALNTINKLIKK